MAKRKKLAKIVDAVMNILKDDIDVKKLKKARSLSRFIEKMVEKRRIISEELQAGGLEKDREKALTRNLETLDKQIKKAGKILEDMEK